MAMAWLSVSTPRSRTYSQTSVVCQALNKPSEKSLEDFPLIHPSVCSVGLHGIYFSLGPTKRQNHTVIYTREV